MIGRLAVETGWISEATLQECLEESRRTSVPLENILVSRGLLKESQIAGLRAVLLFRNQPPHSIGRYEILERLEEGSTALVFRAHDPRLGRDVALKILKEAQRLSEEACRRFMREAQTIAKLRHPGIVGVYEADLHGPVPYIAMELIDGSSLRERRLNPRLAADVIRKVAEAIQAAHDRGIVHRDLKPDNILIDASEEPHVADFGLAWRQDERTSLAASGIVVGTPRYMSPEQARGERVDARSDVYSLGATLYEMLSGVPPFAGSGAMEVMDHVLHRDPAPIRKINSSVPRDLETIAMKCLEKDPERRYPSARALAEDLERALNGEPILARPISRIRRTLLRNKRRCAAAAIGLVISIAGASQWMAARSEKEALAELSPLWTDLILAKKDWYQAQTDPGVTRARIEAALAEISAYIERHPSLSQGYVTRARGRIDLDDMNGAQSDLERALQLDPENGPAWSLLGRVRLEQYLKVVWGNPSIHEERVKQAEPLLARAREALERSSRSSVEETLADAMYVFYVQRDRKRGKKILEEAHARSPSEEYCNRLGQWSQDPRENIRWQTEAIRLMPHYFKAYLRRGHAKNALGRYREALEDFAAALRIKPNDVMALLFRGIAKAGLGDWKGKLEDSLLAQSIDPSHSHAHYHCAEARFHLRDFREAFEDVSRAIEREPLFSEAYVLRARARGRLDDYAGAVEDCTRAIALSPKALGNYVERGGYKLALNDIDGALADFQKDSNDASAAAGRGLCRALMGELSAAQDECARALAQDPTIFIAIVGRGIASAKQQLLDEAERDLDKVVRLAGKHRPERRLALEWLARIRSK